MLVWSCQTSPFYMFTDTLAAKAKEMNCQDAPMYPNCGFLGLKHLQFLQAADSKKMFPDALIERQRVMSELLGHECSTFQFNVLGQKVMFTSDPKNIQAMLATKFDDFGLGAPRRNNMMPTIGDGIFVQDGKAWEHSRGLLRPTLFVIKSPISTWKSVTCRILCES